MRVTVHSCTSPVWIGNHPLTVGGTYMATAEKKSKSKDKDKKKSSEGESSALLQVEL